MDFEAASVIEENKLHVIPKDNKWYIEGTEICEDNYISSVLKFQELKCEEEKNGYTEYFTEFRKLNELWEENKLRTDRDHASYAVELIAKIRTFGEKLKKISKPRPDIIEKLIQDSSKFCTMVTLKEIGMVWVTEE